MKVTENYSLKRLNTFGIDVNAQYFSHFSDVDELSELLEYSSDMNRMILGGGSNVLFTSDYSGIVLQNSIIGKEIIREDEQHVYVRAGAGENWHKLVLYCLEHDLAGMENLSLIPGSVGASPMQNIGAYGVEVKDVFDGLEAFHIGERKVVRFTNADCEFGYRESVFKRRYRGEFVITHVVFRLSRVPRFNTSYGALEDELHRLGKGISIHTISQAVINIRRSKLPDPAEIGNAGSFFKNPTVPLSAFEKLKSHYPSIPGYPQGGGDVKLAAGWLIEQCGWKGYRDGDAGCHAKQALVLVNYGNASGSEIFDLSSKIRDSVYKKFGVELEREVNVIPE